MSSSRKSAASSISCGRFFPSSFSLHSKRRFTSLDFAPEGMHVERLNALVLATNFQQLIGRFTGTLTTAAGERLAIVNMLGFCEDHYAKW